MSWEHLHRLWWILPGVVTLVLIWWWENRRSRPVFVSSGPLIMSQLTGLPVKGLSRFLEAVGVVLALLALAGPMRTETIRWEETKGADMVVLLDRSSSMAAEDFGRSRLAVAKEQINRFLQARPGDQMGLIVFAERAYLRCPLTTDHTLLKQFTVDTDLVSTPEEDGTAIGDGLAASLRLFPEDETRKIIVLLTDGVNTAGRLSPEDAGRLAEGLDVTIHTIGIGREGLVPYPIYDNQGNKSIQQRLIPIDMELLSRLAESTGGLAARASSPAELEQVFADIDRREATITTQHERTSRVHYGPGLWTAALACLGLGLVMRAGWRRGA